MKKLPEEVIKAWNNHKGAVTFAIVDEKGLPNAIYATCVSLFNEAQ